MGLDECPCQEGVLLVRLAADGNNLFFWREVLVLMDHSLKQFVCGGRSQPQSYKGVYK